MVWLRAAREVLACEWQLLRAYPRLALAAGKLGLPLAAVLLQSLAMLALLPIELSDEAFQAIHLVWGW